MKMTVILLLFICIFSSSSITINKVSNKNIPTDTISVRSLVSNNTFFGNIEYINEEDIRGVDKHYRNQVTERYIYFKLDTVLATSIYLTNFHCKNKHIELLKLDNGKLTRKDTLLLNGIKPSFKLKHTAIHTKSTNNEIIFDIILGDKKTLTAKINMVEGFNLLNPREWQNIDSTNSHKKYIVHRKNGFDSLLVTLNVFPRDVIVLDETIDSIFWKNNVNLYDSILYFDAEKNVMNFTKLPNREYHFFYLGCHSGGNFTIEVVD
jgi:hypothetical protein